MRSTADGSVVQFLAGEDGLDPTRTKFLEKPGFYEMNADVLQAYWKPPSHAPVSFSDAQALEVRAALAVKEAEAEAELKRDATRRGLAPKKLSGGYAPTAARLSYAPPGSRLGQVSEAFDKLVEEHVGQISTRHAPGGATGAPWSVDGGSSKLSADMWRTVMWRKYVSALYQPGEAVGLLAAQSVGEPSTQMTLNTFHLAGRGEANVTLGIPRMREIIMVASQHPSTPLMTLPLRDDPSHPMSADEASKAAEKLAAKLSRLRLSDMLEQVTCDERLRPARGQGESSGAQLARRARVYLRLAPRASVGRRELSTCFAEQLLPALLTALRKRLKARASKKDADAVGRGERVGRGRGGRQGGADEEGGEGGGGEGGAGAEDDEAIGGAGSGAEDVVDEDADDAKAASRAARLDEGANFEEPDEEDKATLQKGRSVQRAADDESDDDDDDDDDSDSDSDSDDEEALVGDERPATATAGRSSGHVAPSAASASPPSRASASASAADDEWLAALRAKLISGDNPLVDFGETHTPGSGVAHATSLWIEVELPLRGERLLLVPLVEETVTKVLVRATPSIEAANVLPAGKGKSLPSVMTSGVNFAALANLRREVDVNAVVSNDVYAVLKFYGVEAARATIVSEIKSVFGVYGIQVDPRHLGLIADYMTHEGAYKPLNRAGMESCSSPLLQMSFETTMKFLEKATMSGSADLLTTPSACIVAGLPPKVGTGAFEVHAQLPGSGRKTGQTKKRMSGR